MHVLNNDVALVPISTVKATSRRTMIVTSIMPPNCPTTALQQLLCNTQGDSEEKDAIVDFFHILCSDVDSIINDVSLIRFNQYMSGLAATYFELLNTKANLINNVAIPIMISEEQRTIMMSNSWVYNLTKGEYPMTLLSGTKEKPGDVIYYVPLKLFNAVDILSILTYILNVRINHVGYLPNCSIIDYVFAHGTGCGIHNIYTNDVPSEFKHYSTNLANTISTIFVKPFQNLDVLVLDAIPCNNSIIFDPPIMVTMRIPIEFKLNLKRLKRIIKPQTDKTTTNERTTTAVQQ
ncbi:hypothetical protein SGHV050 [Glossina pallidipes salivary gland hypertrophy virus]|uniref:Uncharacterized protein n=1 Tax=Glossina hytrovirus (isolate Glossina pallidipes/Ethiopia/Seibersdorf/-) TaxID=379529 RepID=B0YLK4_GHVS|nr:hypothetical protein SGHV050 [Glossina pallidipes salivary gland hypertrophy virus]ABQ08823.1 hypothetical protein SGHV050 [Glossina pallidipes salivary gland hypertrophy virus]